MKSFGIPVRSEIFLGCTVCSLYLHMPTPTDDPLIYFRWCSKPKTNALPVHFLLTYQIAISWKLETQLVDNRLFVLCLFQKFPFNGLALWVNQDVVKVVLLLGAAHFLRVSKNHEYESDVLFIRPSRFLHLRQIHPQMCFIDLVQSARRHLWDSCEQLLASNDFANCIRDTDSCDVVKYSPQAHLSIYPRFSKNLMTMCETNGGVHPVGLAL